MSVLKKGSKGKPVEKLQIALNKQNVKPKLTPDGKFGKNTVTATIAFQKQKKLKPDGKVGNTTSFALGLGGNRPKSLDWPHEGETVVMYKKLLEARKFNSEKVKHTIVFAKAAQDDLVNVRKALERKEKMLADTEKNLVKAFARKKQIYNDLGRMLIENEKSTDPVKILELHKKGADLLKALQVGGDDWYDAIAVLGKILVDMKAYSRALWKIKSGKIVG